MCSFSELNRVHLPAGSSFGQAEECTIPHVHVLPSFPPWPNCCLRAGWEGGGAASSTGVAQSITIVFQFVNKLGVLHLLKLKLPHAHTHTPTISVIAMPADRQPCHAYTPKLQQKPRVAPCTKVAQKARRGRRRGS